jgi:hypothetical protein
MAHSRTEAVGEGIDSRLMARERPRQNNQGDFVRGLIRREPVPHDEVTSTEAGQQKDIAG